MYVIKNNRSWYGLESDKKEYYLCIKKNEKYLSETTDIKQALKFYDYESAQNYANYLKNEMRQSPQFIWNHPRIVEKAQ